MSSSPRRMTQKMGSSSESFPSPSESIHEKPSVPPTFPRSGSSMSSSVYGSMSGPHQRSTKLAGPASIPAVAK